MASPKQLVPLSVIDHEDRADRPKPPAPANLCLSPADWVARDIPAQDRLLGDLFSTTTRNQLSADTGLGKTMFALAVNFAMCLGIDFLGWRGHRPARVLIIDGEMPGELIKDRLAAAASWFGLQAPIADGFYLLSREDVEDMPPLDTPAGMRWLLDFIAKLGRVDHVTFDNIASLTATCMKEEEGEAVLRDLRRALTKQKAGQLWLHHTGHDQSRGYGTKTREWHLDTVMVAERLDRPHTDVAFTLKFPKCRRRTPDNRTDFEPIEVYLSQGQWTSAATSGSKGRDRRPNGVAAICLNALRKALTEMGKPPPACPAMAGVQNVVTLDQWRDMFARMASYAEGQDDARRKAFQRGSERLLVDGDAGKWGDFVWAN